MTWNPSKPHLGTRTKRMFWWSANAYPIYPPGFLKNIRSAYHVLESQSMSKLLILWFPQTSCLLCPATGPHQVPKNSVAIRHPGRTVAGRTKLQDLVVQPKDGVLGGYLEKGLAAQDQPALSYSEILWFSRFWWWFSYLFLSDLFFAQGFGEPSGQWQTEGVTFDARFLFVGAVEHGPQQVAQQQWPNAYNAAGHRKNGDFGEAGDGQP